MTSLCHLARRAASGLLILAVVASWSVGARGAEPSSHYLPDETMVVLRMPAPAKFGEAIRERTKLGKVLFGDERLARFRELFASEGDEEWNEFRERLERYQLKPEDAAGLLNGEIGAAMVATSRGKDAPLTMAFAWLEPEPELADRLFAAVEKLVEESQQEETPIRRVDRELAGHPVMQLRVAVTEREPVVMDEEFPDFDDQAAWQRYMEKRARLEAEAKLVQTDQTNIFITRRENRLLFGVTLPNNGSRRNLEEGAENDFDELSSLETAAELFGKFLALHDGPETGVIPRALSTSGIAASLPDGEVWLEAFVDTQAALSLLETAPNENVKSQIEKLGLKGIGPIAYRAALDGNVLRSAAVASAPSPRAGVIALIDQEPLPSEPADWAPATVLSYAQMSFDLPKLYEYVKQSALETGGELAAGQFATIERQCQGTLQTDVPSLLASLGKRHAIVSLLPERNAAPEDENDQLGATPDFASRVAFVWQLGDEELWKRIIKLGATLAAASEGMVTAADEQGFTGLRFDLPGQKGGVFVGRGYLMLGMGPNVVESALATLRKPPAPADSLRGSAVMARAAQLMSLEPGIAFQVNDHARALPLQRQVILEALDAPFAADPFEKEEDSEKMRELRAAHEKIKGLVPSEAELEGALGIGVWHAAVTDEGLILRTALDMPAP